MQTKNIILFASGNGSNAENICRYFQNNTSIHVAALFCNKADAKVLDRMKAVNVPTHVFSRSEFHDSEKFLPLLINFKADLIVLSGFFWLIPEYLVKYFSGKIINIHPALLPKYAGKGMHGQHVHEAVKANGETETGITIHYVNEKYDEGEIIFQAITTLTNNDSIEDIAMKISVLEKDNFPKVIETLLLK